MAMWCRIAVESNLDEAHEQIATLEKNGVSLDEITSELVVDGVKQFADAFGKLMDAVAQRREDAKPAA